MHRDDEAGLTLVEMLVVLAIIGVMAGVTVLAMSDSGVRTEGEARRLASRLELAADETMVTDRAIAFVPEPDGYRFVVWDAAAATWLPDPAGALGDRHALPGGMRLTTDVAAGPHLIGADGAGGAMRVRLTGGDRAWTIVFDGTGATAIPGG